jgi:hypothetical protein
MENEKDGHSGFDLEQAEAAPRKEMIREINEIVFQTSRPQVLTLAEELLALFLDGNLDLASSNMD